MHPCSCLLVIAVEIVVAFCIRFLVVLGKFGPLISLIAHPAIEVDLVARQGLNIAHQPIEHLVHLRLLHGHVVDASERSDVTKCHQVGFALVLDHCNTLIHIQSEQQCRSSPPGSSFTSLQNSTSNVPAVRALRSS